ncbi:MAG: hypothetical protein ACTTJZ_01635 [Sphaerochaetaceae bacterium]
MGDRDVNAYIFDYRSIVSSNDKLTNGVKLETALGSYASPTVEQETDSYVFQYRERNIYKPYPLIVFYESFKTLFVEVRVLERHWKFVCLLNQVQTSRS